MNKKKPTYEQERFEEDRLNLIHKIIFFAELSRWDEVEKYKSLYKEIYGDLSSYNSIQTAPRIIISTKDIK